MFSTEKDLRGEGVGGGGNPTNWNFTGIKCISLICLYVSLIKQ